MAVLKWNDEGSPFTERENIVWGLQLALGLTFNETVLSKEATERIDRLAELKRLELAKQVESWNYFSKVHRIWILFAGLLVLGLALLPVVVGVVFLGGDVFLYRWIRKREVTTPKSSLESLELSRTFARELQILYDTAKVETSRLSVREVSRGLPETITFVGRAVWIRMDTDHSSTVFADRKGIVVRVFKHPPAPCKEAIVVELSSPPITLFPRPRRLRYLIAEYYQKWDSLHYTFNEGHSFVGFLRLKNETALKSDTYRIKDASRIGVGGLSAWPVSPTEARLLGRQREAGSSATQSAN